MGCGCGGKKSGGRARSRQITRPLSLPKKQLISSETLSTDGTLDKDRREIERKRREEIKRKLGRI